MLSLHLHPGATRQQLAVALADFRECKDDRSAASFAGAALSAWAQGLISGIEYADYLDEFTEWLETEADRARRS